MRSTNPSRNIGANREEKETRLTAFITRHLETLRDTGTEPGSVTYRLLALSAESPSARALASVAADLAQCGVAVEVVLARKSTSETAADLAFADCRYAADARLLDAHEQLVLDAGTAWIGDCMRRDQSRRETYEQYTSCPTTTRYAARSFAQIWRAAAPTGNWAVSRRSALPHQPPQFDPALIAGPGEAPPTPVLLRH